MSAPASSGEARLDMGVIAIVSGLLAALLAVMPTPGAAESQSVRRTVGDYELTVSYAHEPPLLEVSNALEVEVRDARSGAPVIGLEGSLAIEGSVTVQSLTRRFPVVFRAARDRPGLYEGVFVPPAMGQYQFRVTGAIGEVSVDETFRSGPGGLPDVEVAGTSVSSPGALLALAILAAYLLAMAALVVWRWRRRRRPAAETVRVGARRSGGTS